MGGDGGDAQLIGEERAELSGRRGFQTRGNQVQPAFGGKSFRGVWTLSSRKEETVFRLYVCVHELGWNMVQMDFKGKLVYQQFIFPGHFNLQSLPPSLDQLGRHQPSQWVRAPVGQFSEGEFYF